MAQQQEPRCGGGGVRRDNKDAGRRHDGGVIVLEMGGGGRGRTEEEGTTWACRAVAAGVAVLGLAGAGVLVWWALAFHPAREQLWMVPVGLVLLGTPLVAWLSLFASGVCWQHAADQPALAMTER